MTCSTCVPTHKMLSNVSTSAYNTNRCSSEKKNAHLVSGHWINEQHSTVKRTEELKTDIISPAALPV